MLVAYIPDENKLVTFTPIIDDQLSYQEGVLIPFVYLSGAYAISSGQFKD